IFLKKLKKNIIIDTAKFTFENGDKYEGTYQIDLNKYSIVKQDQGTYITDNFEVYNGTWNDDKFGGNFHIRYNNNAQYKGNIDKNSWMSGLGTYIFPDESSLTAFWSQNKCISDVIYQEALGYKWTTESVLDNQILFTTGNHFWDKICERSLEEKCSPCVQ
ncbi:uncharacterized protein LOC126849918, partial [Cataglyphis hispanica]|uniref:uncharacterized protein LOC126849918 n=1 Tax=Cataglyphis hispanica TaxID=1086592 RepID=UPI00217F4268